MTLFGRLQHNRFFDSRKGKIMSSVRCVSMLTVYGIVLTWAGVTGAAESSQKDAGVKFLRET